MRIQPPNNEFTRILLRYQYYYNRDCNRNKHVVFDDSSHRMQIDLLQPSDRAERSIDTLAHYHNPISALGGPRATEFDAIAAEFSWNFIFPMVVQYRSLDDPGPASRPCAEAYSAARFSTQFSTDTILYSGSDFTKVKSIVACVILLNLCCFRSFYR